MAHRPDGRDEARQAPVRRIWRPGDKVVPNRFWAIMTAATVMTGCALEPPVNTASAEAVYRQRFQLVVVEGKAAQDHTPQEAVPGALRPASLPRAVPAATISETALAAARRYAAANGSSAFLVWHKGALREATYFGGTSRDTPLVAKSLAKPLTALVIGRALKLGHLRSLDQPASDFIREWRNTPKEGILIRHLLDMRSGLLAQEFSKDETSIWNRAYLHPRHERVLIHQYPLTHAPGARYDYSNANSELVALVIERATGRRYAEFVGNALLSPIEAAGGTVSVNRAGGVAHSGCCISLPAETWMRLALLILYDGSWEGEHLLPDFYVSEMRRPTAQNPHHGLSLWLGSPFIERRGFANPDSHHPKMLHGAPYRADDLFLWDGNANQVVYFVPSEDLIILRTGASAPRPKEWDNAVLPNLILDGIVGRRGGSDPPRQTGTKARDWPQGG